MGFAGDVIYFSITGPTFLTMENALNLSRQGAILMILCMGVIIVKITGGMDLSNGGILSLAGMVLAWCLVKLTFQFGFHYYWLCCWLFFWVS